MIIRAIARLVALIMVVLGIMGSIESPSITHLGLLVVGLATVYGLKSPVLAVPAGILNVGLVAIGVVFAAVTNYGMPPEILRIRYIAEGFLLISGTINATALLLPLVKRPDSEHNLLSLRRLSFLSIGPRQNLLLPLAVFAGLLIFIFLYHHFNLRP